MNTIKMIMMMTIITKMTPPTTPPTIAPIADAVREGEEEWGGGRVHSVLSIVKLNPLAWHCYSFPASDL